MTNTTPHKIYQNSFLGEEYHLFEHSSGLPIYIFPKKMTSTYAIFGTNYGSIHNRFSIGSTAEPITVPDGIAHFLEHKLFTAEDGSDAFERFSEYGADANAYTSFNKTCYLFSCTDRFEDSLRELLNFVTHPYFTKETVEKEQGIIGQEIRMYEDDPSWCVFLGLLKALYWENPIRIDIAGTVETISEITPELLYRTYKTFYNLSNMVLSIAGNFDSKEVLKLCDKLLPTCEDIEIENIIPNEPDDIFLKKTEKKLEVAMPLFEIGFKEKPDETDSLKGQIMNEMLLEMIFGESTEFYQRLYNEGTINSTFGTDVMAGDGYLINMIGGEAPDVQKVYDEICYEIDRVRKEGLSKELFDGVKKSFYGARVSKMSVVEQVATGMLSSYFAGYDAFDSLECVKNIEFEDLEKRFKTQLFEERSSISIVSPM